MDKLNKTDLDSWIQLKQWLLQVLVKCIDSYLAIMGSNLHIKQRALAMTTISTD